MRRSKPSPKVLGWLREHQGDYGGNIEAVRQMLRERCRKDLWFLSYHVLGMQDIDNDLHRDMCFRWMRRRERRYTLWLNPRGHLKTSLYTRAGTIQELLIDPDQRVLIINAKLENAIDIISDIRADFETRELLRWLFPEYCVDLASRDLAKRCKWGVDRLDFPCSKYAGRKEGNIQCMGVEASLVSKHYDLFVFDDPVNDVNTSTKDYRDKVFRWYRNAIQLRDNPQSRIRLIGTRWHHDDLYGRIILQELKRRQEQREAGIPVRPRWLIYHRQVVEPVPDDQLGLTIAGYENVLPIWPERYTPQAIEELKEENGSYIFGCNPGWSPVLMADYSQKRFDEMKAGDEVIGFTFGNGDRPKLVRSQVQYVHHKPAPVVKVTFEDGSHIVCTEDHNWYTGRFDEGRKPYLPAAVGRDVVRVYDLPQKWNEADAGYLAGMLDGEGSLNHVYISITQSMEHNPGVCERIEETLENLGLEYSADEARPGQRSYYISATRSQKIALLANCDLGKRTQLIAGMDRHPGRIGRKLKVVSIEPAGEAEVYSMQTTTGNYVAHGLASKNCQWMNLPVDDEDAVFRRKDVRTAPYYIIPANLQSFMAIDMADEETTQGDFTVLTVASFDVAGRMYVRECVRGKLLPSEILETTYRLCQKWHVQRCGIETTGFQRTIYKEYKRQAGAKGWNIPWVEMNRGKASKRKRILSLQPRVERGDFFIEEGIENFDAIMDELLTYPRPIHDDVLDTLADLEAIYYSAPELLESRNSSEVTFDDWFGALDSEDSEDLEDGAVVNFEYAEAG